MSEYRDDVDVLRLREEVRRLSDLSAMHETEARAQRQIAEAADARASRSERLLAESGKRRDRARWLGYAGRRMFGLGLGVVLASGVVWLMSVAIHSCATAPPLLRAGIITDRYHHPAYTTVMCTPSGKTTACHPVYHPERWTVEIARGGADREAELAHEQWEGTRVGEFLCVEPPCPRDVEQTEEMR